MNIDAARGVPEGEPQSHARGQKLIDLVKVMERLRGPGGCPWDREQTHKTLARHLLEETHETLEAIDSGDDEMLKDELGDVLLQVVFHAELGREQGSFDVDDVAEAVIRKLTRRHPHVFGDTEVASAAEVLVNWEKIKQEEKGERAVDEDIPETLPALARAAKVQRRAAGLGFDWRTTEGAAAKVREELAELERELAAGRDGTRLQEELGDLLFAVASVGQRIGVDPEASLRRATKRFSDRFELMKQRASEDGVSLEELSDDELLARFREAR